MCFIRPSLSLLRELHTILYFSSQMALNFILAVALLASLAASQDQGGDEGAAEQGCAGVVCEFGCCTNSRWVCCEDNKDFCAQTQEKCPPKTTTLL